MSKALLDETFLFATTAKMARKHRRESAIYAEFEMSKAVEKIEIETNEIAINRTMDEFLNFMKRHLIPSQTHIHSTSR